MKVSSIGKFLDQPLLTNSLSRKMPLILASSAAAFGIKDTLEQQKDERKKIAVKNAIILGTITLSSVLASRFIKIKGESLLDAIPKEEILLKQRQVIDNFVAENKNLAQDTVSILNKAKNKILCLKDTDCMLEQISDKKNKDRLVTTLFGGKDDITSGKILQEISKLSIMGFIPVASGILGGIAADKAINDYSKEKTTNKLKEGIYQFFANIFLCNVGAGTFLYTAEKMHEKGLIKKLTPLKKTVVILGGILSVGVFGGSHIANFIGNKVVNPIVDKFNKNDEKKQCKKEERKPEALDIALHTDDIATAGVLSGLKWIEPLLPVMYLVSGYRSAIGYRNTNLDKDKNHTHN